MKRHSVHDVVECLSCHSKIRHLPTLELQGVNCDFPYGTVGEWYDAQKAYVNAMDLTCCQEKPMFRDEAKISEVIPYKHKVPFRKKANVALNAEGADKNAIVSDTFSSIDKAVRKGALKKNTANRRKAAIAKAANNK